MTSWGSVSRALQFTSNWLWKLEGLFLSFFFFFLSFLFFFYAAYFIIINPGAKRYVWLRRASPLISAITAPRRGVRAEPLEDAGVPRRCLDKGDKRQGEKGKKTKTKDFRQHPPCLRERGDGIFSC